MASSQRACERNDGGAHTIGVILITQRNLLSAIMNITVVTCFVLDLCVMKGANLLDSLSVGLMSVFQWLVSNRH